MSKPDLVAVAPLPAAQMAELEQDFTVHRLPPKPERAAFIAALADKVRFMQTTGFYGADAELIDAFPKLEIIGCFGVGVDAVDVPAATRRGIIVTNTPDVLNDCVADLAMTLILAVSRRIVVGDRYLREGKWEATGPMPLAAKVSGKKLGILGLGRIGKVIAKRAKGFDMKLAYHGRQRQPVKMRYFDTLSKLARWSDFLVVICPGGPATRNLVNAEVLKALGKTGAVINVARGSVIDEPALVAALKNGTLGGAGLDVFADEPHVPAELMTMDNVVLLPHVGSGTVETRKAMADLTVANLRAYLRGEPLPSRYN
ncbi:MAG: 2-hydroxyacid dehydrogenase [Rhodospirillales bacterium]|nr:2-hydroxyacid dehydrogenase [Rhodospirillales bacterium]